MAFSHLTDPAEMRLLPFQTDTLPSLKLCVLFPDLACFKALNLLWSGNETKPISKSTGQPLVQDEAENVLAAATLGIHGTHLIN